MPSIMRPCPSCHRKVHIRRTVCNYCNSVMTASHKAKGKAKAKAKSHHKKVTTPSTSPYKPSTFNIDDIRKVKELNQRLGSETVAGLAGLMA